MNDDDEINELFDAEPNYPEQPVARDEDGDDDPDGPPIYFVSLTVFEIERLLAERRDD